MSKQRTVVNILIVSEFQMHISILVAVGVDFYNFNISNRMFEIRKLGTKPLLITTWDSFLDPFNPTESEVLLIGMICTLKPYEVDLIWTGAELLNKKTKMQNDKIKLSAIKIFSEFLDSEVYEVRDEPAEDRYV